MRIAPATSVFEVVSRRARATGAVNLGQGFPDGNGPKHVRKAIARAALDGPQQYPPMIGLPELREQVAARGPVRLDPDAEVTVTSGATEALASAILALVSPGDAVVVIAPAYDLYAPMVARAGAEVRWVFTRAPGFAVDPDELNRAADGAAMIIVCDPMNPLGRRLTVTEQAGIARAAVAHGCVVLADEVWDSVTLPGCDYLSLAAFPELRERIVCVGSAGKVFGMTGVKVGWMCAAPALTARLRAPHQYLAFTTPPALQAGIAEGLAGEAKWAKHARAALARGRARLAKGLEAAGYAVLPGDATWFLNIDLAASGVEMDDAAFNDLLIDRHGVAGIPVSAFYPHDAATNLLRLCHAKADETLDAGLERLAAARRDLRPARVARA